VRLTAGIEIRTRLALRPFNRKRSCRRQSAALIFCCGHRLEWRSASSFGSV